MNKNKNDAQEFGGPWTEEKIGLLRKYLSAYTRALKYKPTSSRPFKLLYIDAFAGTGHFKIKKTVKQGGMLGGKETIETIDEKDGSAKVALSLDIPFNKYIFIDTEEDKISQLQEIAKLFPVLQDRIVFKNSDAILVLEDICKNTDWRSHRAVLFLDPFGLQVPWSTVEKIAQTQFIDMWFLFPISAINRMLTKNGIISTSWSDRLTTVFGTEEWRKHFYKESKQTSLWETEVSYQKDASFKKISDYVVNRLESVFAGVSKNPRILRSSTNSPLFLLCFAVGNPDAKTLALKIANSILK